MCDTRSVIENCIAFYKALDHQSLSKLRELYHDDARLIDPFGQHQGLPAIEHYFDHLLSNVTRCWFDVDQPLCEGDRAALSWVMHWAHPKLRGGEPLALAGCSILLIREGRIAGQQDYYDAGSMVYEHIPLLGYAVRHVKQRVAS